MYTDWKLKHKGSQMMLLSIRNINNHKTFQSGSPFLYHYKSAGVAENFYPIAIRSWHNAMCFVWYKGKTTQLIIG